MSNMTVLDSIPSEKLVNKLNTKENKMRFVTHRIVARNARANINSTKDMLRDIYIDITFLTEEGNLSTFYSSLMLSGNEFHSLIIAAAIKYRQFLNAHTDMQVLDVASDIVKSENA